MIEVYEIIEVFTGGTGHMVRRPELRSDLAAFWLRYYRLREPGKVFDLHIFALPEDHDR